MEIPPAFSWIEFVHAVALPINDFLETRSHLFTLMKTRLRPYLIPLVYGRSFHPPVFDLGEAESERWDVTSGICYQIAQAFASRSVPVLFVLIPMIYQVHQEMWPRHLELYQVSPETVDLTQPNEILSDRFADLGLVLLDPLTEFRTRFNSGARLHGSVDTHFNSEGNRQVAEFLLARMRDEPSLSGLLLER